jgi:hypothetical protein
VKVSGRRTAVVMLRQAFVQRRLGSRRNWVEVHAADEMCREIVVEEADFREAFCLAVKAIWHYMLSPIPNPMKTLVIPITVAVLLLTGSARAQVGPFDPETWPGTIDPSKLVHYVVTDGGLEPPGFNWQPDALTLLSGGDQVTADITIGGHQAKRVTGNYLNVADPNYWVWSDQEFIDILVQVYGDAAVLSATGEPRDFEFLTGVLPDLNSPVGGQIPVEARNQRWNWVLFRIPNAVRPSDGERYVGSIPPNAEGTFQNGGVNGGTIRFQSVPNLIVRAVAFGEEGAFGEPEAINQFLPPEECDPEPETNFVGIDINTDMSNHVVVLNDQDQMVFYDDNVGPPNDVRRAIGGFGDFMNFGVTDEYLGKPCNEPRTIKVCVDFYDDPSFASLGIRFGPEAYATDDQGGIAFVPEERRHVLQGTGEWIRRSWTLSSVNLSGVNTGSLTGGPRFIAENGLVYVSRFEMAVVRVGDHPLAGQDPLADCMEDPNICTDLYGNYAELDLANDVRDGLDVGSSGGDQEMIVAEAGPAGDRRLAVRPAREDGSPGAAHQYLNFAILDEALGPNSQPPAHLAICVTYYDDPALAEAQFRPEVYVTERNGSPTFGFTPTSYFVTLTGSDEWRTAYWEIPDVKFIGVNQGPQAAARFELSDKIFFSRVRYAVIRPCGPLEGVNLLEECRPPEPPLLGFSRPAGDVIRLSWPVTLEGFALEQSSTLDGPGWEPVTLTPEIEGEDQVISLPLPTAGNTFYRLVQND